jgi:hypothetical protein
MVYVPIAVTVVGLSDKLFQNMHRLVSEYKYTNTSVGVQDDIQAVSYPVNVLFIPEKTENARDFKSNNNKRAVAFRIDFACLPTQGYRQLSLMSDSVENGFLTENNNLYLARLRYLGNQTLFTEPIDVNGQLVYTKGVEYYFEVLL